MSMLLRTLAQRAAVSGVRAAARPLATARGAASIAACAASASAPRLSFPAARTTPYRNVFCNCLPPMRAFSASAALAAASGASSTATPSLVEVSPPVVPNAKDEIKLMAHYIGPQNLASIVFPSSQASRAYRFTQPNSVLIPLDVVTSATGNLGASRTLADLFTLPPVPVAPIVRIPSASSTPASSASVLPSSASLPFDAQRPFMVAFAYGAIVFFNVPEAMQQEILPRGTSEAAKLKDDYKILLRGTDNTFQSCRFLTDSVEVTGLDLNSVRIFSQILSQAVAMQHYEGEANRLLLKLRAMLRPSELHKGVPTFGSERSAFIVSYVAESSTAMVDVLTELKLLDRSEIVWGSGQYDPLWSGLRREFDLSDRWEALQTKLDLLSDSHPFFLQVIHQIQGHRMEIIIILLIAIEVLFGTIHLLDRYYFGHDAHAPAAPAPAATPAIEAAPAKAIKQ